MPYRTTPTFEDIPFDAWFRASYLQDEQYVTFKAKEGDAVYVRRGTDKADYLYYAVYRQVSWMNLGFHSLDNMKEKFKLSLNQRISIPLNELEDALLTEIVT